jgi:MAE_28990/MAE_18760-like HEPN
VKQAIKDDLGALKLIVKLRNDLAHGSISFGECSANTDLEALKDLRQRTVTYLGEVIVLFKEFIDQGTYLQPEHRPSA